jgi:putative NADH-flavin reductase
VAKLDGVGSGLHTFQGDVFDANAIEGHDAIIVCLGSSNLRDKTTLSVGTKNIVDGMVRYDVERLVIISATF